jgi:STE24 endopeptidase
MFLAIVLGLLAAKVLAELWLMRLNRQEVSRHAGEIPAAFRGTMDDATYKKAVDYTLAKARFSQFEIVYDAVVLALLLLSGVLPWLYRRFLEHAGTSAAAQAAFLLATGFLLSIPSLPVNWAEQFRLEERFGFNTSTQKTWWLDRLKGLALAAALGFPLLLLVLKLVQWMDRWWWLWAFAIVLAFQLLMVVLAPVPPSLMEPCASGSCASVNEPVSIRGRSRSWTEASARAIRTPSSPGSANSGGSCFSTP